jgi:integrator complex subunit 1
VLFMVDKPEQCYTIDNWPSEQERGTMFRVVSEIPVLSETLHQVLIITKSIPDHMFMLMLCVEENLLKTAALVHAKDIYSLKLNRIEQFIQSLFNICQYTYQNPPTVPLAVTVLYWRAWQILLIVTALDPKGFGLVAWEKYPTLRLLMEMVMTEDYNYPPQSSITDEMNVDQFRSFETQVNICCFDKFGFLFYIVYTPEYLKACFYEKQEILEFENLFEMKQASKIVRTEANSKLIGQVMKFDPT